MNVQRVCWFAVVPVTLMAMHFIARQQAVASEPAENRKPNVVIIYIDDLAYADIAPFGSKKNRTPNLERMANEGMKLTSFYAAPVCTASRAMLLTGCYAKRVGMPGVLYPVSPVGLNRSEKTLAEYLKMLGYVTSIIGKWHLGDQIAFLPTRRGFDHFFGLPYSNDMMPNPKQADNKSPPLPLLRDETVIEAPAVQSTLTERYTDEAVKFLQANKDKPFFLYLPHTAIHAPRRPGKAFAGKSNNGVYGDWIEEVDWSVGKVMDTIRELKLEKDTVVLFSSDNGGTPQGDNGPLRENKASTWEGGVRVCALAWWPGKIPAGSSCNEMASVIDVLPTVVELAGGKVDAERVIDGKDIRPLLFAEPSGKTPHQALYFFNQGEGALEAVRSGPWKYRLVEKTLYNLETDLGESTDEAAANPEVVERMLKMVQLMEADLGVTKAGPGCRPSATVANPQPLVNVAFNTIPAASARTADNFTSEYYYDFRGKSVPPELKLFNVKPEVLVREEPEGLRITIPPTLIHEFAGVGFKTTFGLKGNFEVTTGIEILRSDVPSSGFGCGVQLYVAKAGGGGATICRLVRGDGNPLVLWGWDTTPGFLEGRTPCKDMRVRLRLKRTGGTLSFLWAPGIEGDDFQQIHQCDFGNDDIERIRWSVLNGRTRTHVDARLLDIRVRSDLGTPPNLVAAKGGVAVVVLIGLGLTLLLFFGAVIILYVRRRRKEARPPDAGAVES